MIWWAAYSVKLYYYLCMNSFWKNMLLRPLESLDSVSSCYFYFFISIICYFYLIIITLLIMWVFLSVSILLFLGIIQPVHSYFLTTSYFVQSVWSNHLDNREFSMVGWLTFPKWWKICEFRQLRRYPFVQHNFTKKWTNEQTKPKNPKNLSIVV